MIDKYCKFLGACDSTRYLVLTSFVDLNSVYSSFGTRSFDNRCHQMLGLLYCFVIIIVRLYTPASQSGYYYPV